MIERLYLFAAQKNLTIVKECGVQHGRQVVVSDDTTNVYCTFYNTKNILMQGHEGKLKSLLKAWAGKQDTDASGQDLNWPRFLVADLPSGWREWGDEAVWLRDYISANGIPIEDRAPESYKIRRERVFHDFMFRMKSFETISPETIAFVVKNWLDRFCFVGLEVEDVINDLLVEARGYLENNDDISISALADAVSNTLGEHCTRRFMDIGGRYVCPQTNKDQNVCVYDIVDAVYPYSNAGEVVAYTKTNFKKLLRHYGRDLKWYSLSLSSPIELKMEEGLRDAGILYMPQYQAFDDIHKYSVDFVIKTTNGPMLAIECDGLQYHAHRSTYIKDRRRDRYLQQRGFYMMRFSSVEIFNQLEECIQEIDEAFWRIQRGELTLKHPPRTSYFGVGE